MPQVFRIVLPTWANEAISMIKNTSVCYLIAVPELMTQAKIMISRFYNTIESYSTVAIFYLVIIGVMTIIFSVAEKKIKIPGLTIEKAKK
jgi:polar amino acid transport system permease protein